MPGIPPKKRRSLKETVSAITGAMDLPVEAFAKNARIELISNREATIDGCRGVLEYTPESIRVNIGHITVRFSGRGLELRSLNDHEAVITGFIAGVDFA